MYKELRLKRGKEKALLNRHPWVFSGAVLTPANEEDGNIVKITDNAGHFLAYGFYSTRSQIVARAFEFSKRDSKFSDEYWKEKLRKAFTLRKSFLLSTKTDTYRLIHAEGDNFPGLIVDVYGGTTAVIQISTSAAGKLIDTVSGGLTELGITSIFFKNPGNKKNSDFIEREQGWIAGSKTDLIALEHGLKFLIDIEKGQKTGFFIDQRENRQLVRKYSPGKKVLNAFSYSGGFSVYAAAGEATQVDSVDISADAIDLANRNFALNFPDKQNHRGVVRDCFDFLRETDEKYELIILDPPAFAKNAGNVNQAARGYKDLNLQAFKKIQNEGIVFSFSCSQHIDKDLFRKIVFSAASDSGKEVRILEQLTQPIDHPVNIYHPEGEYLKGLILYIS
jgi:23S rRNA (cytosine1962-C5)-methyltransferase